MILLIREYNKAGILHECPTTVAQRRSGAAHLHRRMPLQSISQQKPESQVVVFSLYSVRPFTLIFQYPTLILA